MKRWATLIAVLLGLMVLCGCGEGHDWNQKVTVTLETPSGQISGSSVQWVKWVGGEEPKVLQSGPNMAAEKRGEAVVVELDGARYLFALLIGDGKSFKGQMEDIAQFAFCTGQDWRPGAKCPTKIESLPYGTSAELEGDNLPMLVTFKDINDPKTVMRVDPNDLDAAFGLCADGSGLKDADAPWRAEGMLWLDWRDMEAWKTSRVQASANAGLPDAVALALAEFDIIAPQAITRLRIQGLIRQQSEQKYQETPPARVKQLMALFTQSQFDAWQTERFTLFKSLIAAGRRDTKADCHRLKAITVEITNEKVTEGAVGRVLGWEKNLAGSIGNDMNLPYGHFLNQINDGSFATGETK